MAFDQTTRNRLARFVSDARALLTEEFTRQLQNEYGLDPASGDVAPIHRLTALDDRQRETARILRETLDYYLAANPETDKKAYREVLDRIVREQAFTVLNRLCALRMSEARGLVLEAIAKEYQSKGFQLYASLAGSALGETGDAYRSYLFSLMDEFAVDLPVLFDRFSPQGRLFPRETALLKLLELINDPELEALWAEDETIGWVYQYFNSKEERKAMRDASQAPRNSRELAVRNQFFTPRYVVEFLTDNTLGRIWCEMTKGDTALKETCRYLVRRPSEIFLQKGEEAPEQPETDENLLQEELLRLPVYIPHRPLKDPREIKMLDPACGSMHFGLYAFDLFEQIYTEAWDLEDQLGDDAMQRQADLESLHKTYPNKEAFLKDVPRLIIERNIHGVDIDPRAVQIAGLSLWLRAQKSWQMRGLHSANRPQIRKSNVVCAEPMPGDREMLEEFLSTLRGDGLEALMRKAWHVPPGQKVRATPQMADALAKLVRTVWDEMELAGEAGSLLKIEETLRDAISTARKDSEDKSPLFRVLEFGLSESPKEKYVQLVAGEDQDFFDRAEALVLTALKDYAELTLYSNGYRRRLFIEDVAQGFALINLCQTYFDCVVMNPPFGAYPEVLKNLIDAQYPEIKHDLAAIFIQQGLNRLNSGGLLGAITTRTILTLTRYEDWRRKSLLEDGIIQLLADLGYGVLDDAMVEVAVYTITKRMISTSSQTHLISCFGYEDKGSRLLNLINEPDFPDYQYILAESMQHVPGAVLASNINATLINRLRLWEPLESQGVKAKVGLKTGDDKRFLRLRWEVDSDDIGIDKKWCYFAKGGEWYPYWGDIFLLILWEDNGKQHKESGEIPASASYYFMPGLTYPERTTSNFGPRILPKGSIFSTAGQAIFASTEEEILAYLGLLLSRPGQLLIELSLGSGDSSVPGTAARHYLNGMINRLPFPSITNSQVDELSEIALKIVNLKRSLLINDETSANFISPFDEIDINSLRGCIDRIVQKDITLSLNCAVLTRKIESLAEEIFGLDDDQGLEYLNSFIGPLATDYPSKGEFEDEADRLFHLNESELVTTIRSEAGFGKRYITKNSQLINRKFELISHMIQRPISDLLNYYLTSHPLNRVQLTKNTEDFVSYFVGCCFGRWDINIILRDKVVDALSNPFNPLPPIAAGMRKFGQDEMASSHDLRIDLPQSIYRNGITVCDKGHVEDLGTHVREIVKVIWHQNSDSIESEICRNLDVQSLNQYFCDPNLFFASHLQRYSKSRRAAPIYWPLSTPSCSYVLWLYYHRLNDQILYTCVNDFVDPKIKQVTEEATRLRLKKGRSVADEKELERLMDFERELKDFREELLRVASFWKPNLNDGVEITASPLWKLFQHKPWQKRLKETWQKLEAGEYDWAHLAYSIWPERVREKCKKDKSLATAHNLEALFVEPHVPAKKRKTKKPIIEEQTESWIDED